MEVDLVDREGSSEPSGVDDPKFPRGFERARILVAVSGLRSMDSRFSS